MEINYEKDRCGNELRELFLFFHNTAIFDDNFGGGSAISRTVGFNVFDNRPAFDNFTKYDMLAIKPRSFDSGDEELGAVGVRTSVGHGEETIKMRKDLHGKSLKKQKMEKKKRMDTQVWYA